LLLPTTDCQAAGPLQAKLVMENDIMALNAIKERDVISSVLNELSDKSIQQGED
jgi:hypothetical protein